MSIPNTIVQSPFYKSHMTPRNPVITRRSQYAPPRPNVQSSTYGPNNPTGVPGLNPSAVLLPSAVPLKPKSPAVNAITENREKDKRELMQLNDKFANYLERVRFLEANNKKLQLELDALKNRQGNETEKIKNMYDVELKEAHQLIDNTSKDKDQAEKRAKQAAQDADRIKKQYDDAVKNRDSDKKRIDDLNRQISENEAEINLLRRRLGDLDEEAKRYKAETDRLIREIQRITGDLDAEVLQRVQLENEKNALEEELSFLKQRHQQQLDELRQNSFVDPGIDASQFFKSELANAIKDIRNEYDKLNNNQRNDMEQWYRMKIQEIQTKNRPDKADAKIARDEINRLRQVSKDQLRDIANVKAKKGELEARIKELEELLKHEKDDANSVLKEKQKELDDLNDRLDELNKDYAELNKMKTSLDDEIKEYRRLLEGDEKGNGLKQVVEGIEDRARNQLLSSLNPSKSLNRTQ